MYRAQEGGSEGMGRTLSHQAPYLINDLKTSSTDQPPATFPTTQKIEQKTVPVLTLSSPGTGSKVNPTARRDVRSRVAHWAGGAVGWIQTGGKVSFIFARCFIHSFIRLFNVHPSSPLC